MASTRETLRGRLLDAIGYAPFSGNASRTTSGAGNANKLTLVDTALADYGDDYFAGWWAVLPDGPSGSGSYEARQAATAANSFVSSTGTLTVARAFSAQVASGAAYELMPHDPAVLHSALNQACRHIYPHIYVAKRDETLVVDNRLLNWDFETAGANPPVIANWTAWGSPTIVQETAGPWHSSNIAKITSAAGEAGGVYQAIANNPFEVFEQVGKSVTFKGKAWCATADTARIGVSFDNGTTWTWSNYSAGADEWETLYVTPSIPVDATSVRCYLSVAAGAKVGYFDYAWAKIDRLYRYTVPSTILLGPNRLTYNIDQNKAEGDWAPVEAWHIEADGTTRYLILDSYVPAGSILHFEGQGTLSTMASDTATTEVDDPMTETLVAMAAWRLFAMLDASAAGQENDYRAKAADWRTTYERLALTSGMHSPLRVVGPHQAWSYG